MFVLSSQFEIKFVRVKKIPEKNFFLSISLSSQPDAIFLPLFNSMF